MLEIDEKAMAYCLVEALFAAGVINLPTYQNFLRMKREQEEEPPAKYMLASQQSMRRKSMRWKISWSGIKSNVPGIRTGKSWRST